MAATGVSSMSDQEVGMVLDKVIEEHIAVVKEKGMGSSSMLMGRAMSALRGKADGQKINAMLKEKLTKLVN